MDQIAIYFLWAAWVVSWMAASVWTARTKHRPPFGEELISRVFTVIGALLLFGLYSPRYVSVLTLWHVEPRTGWFLAGMTAAGFWFFWWGRISVGNLLSGLLTV